MSPVVKSQIHEAGVAGNFQDADDRRPGRSSPMIISPDVLLSLEDYVLLDNGNSREGWGTNLLFTRPRRVIQAMTPDEVPRALAQLDRFSRRKWLAGYLRYEAAAAFLPSRYRKTLSCRCAQGPLVWFGVYDDPVPVAAMAAANIFAAPVAARACLSYLQYARAIRFIKARIQAGETYQVNFTFDFLLKAGCSAEFLYFLLRRKQATSFGAAIRNVHERILSFSPELFFERQGQMVRTRPMKGTAPRGRTDCEDLGLREALAQDGKNRAENLMIVDLLRNDLGRICEPGSVRVLSLFDVETHPTLHQMTSRIEGRLRERIGYREIFASLFPCGSVTGAPKIRTMEIIDALEQGSRGVYCGAIGYTDPGGRAVFSVPIRTLQQAAGRGDWMYRAGSGVVWDSGIRSEWREVHLKTAFLTAQPVPEFDLLETMLWDGGQIRFHRQHLNRLRCSARQLGFSLDRMRLSGVLDRIKIQGRSRPPMMIRLLASRDGKIRFEWHTLKSDRRTPVVRPARVRLDRHNAMLRHKTTWRPWYEETWQRILKGEFWDEIFLNQDGEICEGARSSVFLRLADGRLYTPPLSSGLLPGILRQSMLDRGECRAKTLTGEDLKSAAAVYCGNSVRGLVQVAVRWE